MSYDAFSEVGELLTHHMRDPEARATALRAQVEADKHAHYEARRAAFQAPPAKVDPPAAGQKDAAPAAGDGGMTKRLADAITKTHHFAVDAGGKLYVYQDGAYKLGGEALLARLIKALVVESGENWTTHRAKEVVEFIRVDAPKLWEQPPTNQTCVRNGIIEVDRDGRFLRLLPHTPEFLSPVQLPVKFDPKATCPHTERFVATTYPEDAPELAFELRAWLMFPDMSHQKAVLMLGDGSNGKSTELAAIIAGLGKPNISSLSLQKIEGERFAAARLLGKLANICPDLPSAHLSDTSTFKALVGGDWLAAEYKHRDGFEFLPFARLLFSANHPPQSSDASHAFFRRWLVVPFERTFEGAEIIPRDVLDARLADPKELSGVLNRALAVLPKLRRDGFTESESMRRAWSELRETTDPLAVWLDQATIEEPEAVVIRRDLWRAYSVDCRAKGRPPVAENAFGRALLKLRPHLLQAQRTLGQRREWVWLGLGLRAENGAQAAHDAQVSSNCESFEDRWWEREK